MFLLNDSLNSTVGVCRIYGLHCLVLYAEVSAYSIKIYELSYRLMKVSYMIAVIFPC